MKKQGSFLRLFGSLCALLVGTGTLTHAQTPATATSIPRVRAVYTTEFPQLTLDVATWDVHGVAVPNLSIGDFTIWEDGQSLGAPDSVTSNSTARFDFVLALDVSGSMAAGDALPATKQAAQHFLERLRPIDQATVLGFNDQVDTSLLRNGGLTNNKELLSNYIADLVASGETHLYEAAAMAVRALPNGEPSHQAVVLFTDGHNEGSSAAVAPQEAVRLAQLRQIPIFVISLGKQVDSDYLESLASQTGGAYLPSSDSSELEQSFQKVIDLLQQQYQLTYRSLAGADQQSHQTAVGFKGQAAGVAWRWQLAQPTSNAPSLVDPVAVQSGSMNNDDSWLWTAGVFIVLILGLVGWIALRRR